MNTMKGGGKSKKMLFFIVLLFVIIQAVTIIGLAGGTEKDTEITPSESLEPVSPIEQIMAAFNTAPKLEEETSNPDKTLKINEKVPTDSSDSPSSPPSTDAPTTSSSGSSAPSTTNNTEDDCIIKSDDSDVKEEEGQPESEPNSPNKDNYNFTLTNTKPTLVINAPKRVNAGDTIEINVIYDGKPVPEATVEFLGTSVTDKNGTVVFKIPKPLGPCKLIFTGKKLGYKSTSGFIEIFKPNNPPYVQPSNEKALKLLNIQYALEPSILDRLAFQNK